MRHVQDTRLTNTSAGAVSALWPLQEATSALERGDWLAAHRQIDEVAHRLAARANWLEEDLRLRYAGLAHRFAEHARCLRARLEVADGPSPSAPQQPGPHDDASGTPADPLATMICSERLRRLLLGRFVLPLRHPEQAALYRQQAGGGLLLFGPPGTGKTHLVRALARELSVPVFSLSPSEVMSKWLGDSEKQLAEIFAQARRVPAALVFIDEIDVLAPRRDAAGAEAGGPLQRLMVQLLTELDGFHQRPGQVIFVGATNRPWALDEALLRPGRFDALAWVGLPEAGARADLLAQALHGVPMDPEMDWPAGAEALAGRSVAQILACARHAAQRAFERTLKSGTEQSVRLDDLLLAANATTGSEDTVSMDLFREFAARHAVPDLIDSDEPPLEPLAVVGSDVLTAASPEAAVFEPLRFVQARDLRLELETLPFVSYAMQHAGLASVRQISLTNQGTEESQNLLVEVALVPSDLGEAWSTNLAALPAGEVWNSGALSLPLRLERLRTVVEKEQAHLRITVRDRDEVLLARTECLPVLAFNEWVYLPKFLELTAAYVQPNSVALHAVVQAASRRLAAATGSGAFSGYQAGGAVRVLQMLSALHETLAHDLALDYINPPPSFEQSGQKVRLVADTLAQGRGTCLDLALLQAALWEHIGLEPLVVLVPGHAFLGCWMTEGQHGRAAVTELRSGHGGQAALAVQEAVNKGQMKLFNSVEVAQRQTLADAEQQGMGILREVLAQGRAVQLIDVSACRATVTPLP